MRALRLTFFTLLIAVSAHAAIRMSPEIGIVNPVRAPLDGNETAPVIATDGDQFMVFWTTRDGVSVAHVAADGRLLSSRLALVSPWAFQLSATWTGAVYLATWGDSAGKSALVAATFNANGDLLSGPTAIVSGMAQTRTGALASNGRRTLLLYVYNYGAPGDVEAAIFDVRGNLIATDRPILAPGTATSPKLSGVPSVASDGEEFAIVWRTNAYVPLAGAQADPPPLVLMHDFHLIRAGEDGGVIGSAIDIGRTGETPDFSVAFGGGLYAIVTTESYPAQARLLRFLVDARGGSVARMPTIDIDRTLPQVFWSGSTFVAYWIRSGAAPSAIMTLPFSGAKESVAPAPVTSLTGNAFEVAIGSNGHHAFAAWNQDTGAVYGAVRQVYGTLFESEASHPVTADAPALLSIGWSRQLRPVMASSATGSLIIWIEDGYSGGQLLGMRTDAAGAFVDRAPFEIATGVSQATVVFAGGVYVVAWQEGGDLPTVVARSVAVDGSLGLAVALGLRMALGSGWSVAAASNGSTALVVFVGSHLFGYRFDALGRQVDTNPLVIGDGGYFPQVASNGTDFFVAWNRGFFRGEPLPPGFDIFGARVTAGGAVDAEPLPIATAPAEEQLQAIASDGRDYLVAYEWSQLTYGVPDHIETKVVLREGQLDGATATDQGTIIASDATYAVSLSGDAAGYWSAYLQLNGTGNLLRLDKHGNRVLAAVPVAAGLSSVALGPLPGGAVRMLYARAVEDGEFRGTSRIFFRSIGEDPTGRSRAARH